MDFEVETTRTGLANAFAAAGAELLGYMDIVSTAVAAIPDTQPQKYAIAGTLPGILQMAGKMIDEDAATPAVEPVAWMRRNLKECKTDAEVKHMASLEFGCWKEIAASYTIPLYAAPAHPVSAAEKPTGDLPDEQIYALWKQAIDQFQKHEYGKSVHPSIYLARAIARAAIAAHLERQAQAKAEQDERTYMGDKQAYEWAWDQVKRDVGTDGWTCGEHGNYFGFFLHGWRYGKQYERQGTTAAPASQEGAHAAQWISVDDSRKPEVGKPILMFVRTLTRGEDDEGQPYETEGAEVAMGEYRKSHGYDVHYFDCYTSPMSDNDWITHWMPLPPAPTPACAERSGDHA